MVRRLTFCFVLLILCCTLTLAQQDAEVPSQAGFKLISSNNPSSYGDPVDFTAIFPEGTSGTVTFKSGVTTLATRDIALGQANYSTANLRLGTHTISAVYNGDNRFAPAVLTQVVQKADPSVVLNCSPNSSVYGQSVECEATLPAKATGTVTFFDEDTVLATNPTEKGSVVYTMPRLSTGSHLLTAAYSGDKNYRSSHGRQVQTILQADSWVSISCSPNPAWFGESITCVAQAPNDATGSILFGEGQFEFSKVKLTGGRAVWTTPGLNLGYHYVGASYRGDDNYRGSSAGVTETVLDPFETY